MTRAEAIKMLNRLLLYCDECPHGDCEKCVEAINMAEDALEQGPSCRNTRQVDLISRQAAIDAIAKFVPYAICDESTESYMNGLMDAYNLICQLPSAQLRGMSKYIKLEDAIHAIAENMAQEANLKEHCNEPTFCAGEFLVEAEMSVKDLPTIEVSNDCISKDVMHAIDMAIEALEQQTCDNCKFNEETDGMNCYECLKGMNDNFEALDQEPKQGKWEHYLKEGLKWKCSGCGSRYTVPWSYCPNCGARMESDEQ